MRFHVKYNEANIFIGFTAKTYRFIFYTHGRIFTAADWKKFIDTFKLNIYDEEDNLLTWDEFIRFVDHLQYFKNSTWVNNYMMSKDGYNFSNNGKKTHLPV